MAQEASSTTKIDLRDFTCKPHSELSKKIVEHQSKTDLTMPCRALGWCPYGDLAHVFPADSQQAVALELSEHRFPITCSHTQKHCPVYYLAGMSRVYGSPLAKCTIETVYPDCQEPFCRGCKAPEHQCPNGPEWLRGLKLEDENFDLRQAELVGLKTTIEMLDCRDDWADLFESLTVAEFVFLYPTTNDV